MDQFNTPSTTTASTVNAPVVKQKKKFTTKPGKQVATAAAAVDTPPTTPEARSTRSGSSASAAAAPVEPEQHVDGDVVESAMRKLKGTRPELLRTSTFYEGAKGVYIFLAGLPVLNGIAPTVEAMAESLINMTPLKPSPEEAEQKSVAVLDKKICEALSYADEVVDVKKDETIEGIVSVKKTINTLGPVQAVVGAACNVGDGVGKAYGSANDTVGSVWHQVFVTVTETYTGVTTMAGETVTRVADTAGGAVNHVTTTTGDVVNSAKCTAGSTVEGVKSFVGSTTESIGSNVNWATTTAWSLIDAAVAYPVGLVQSVMGTKKSDASPEK
ncbi:expressed unknown protein [Ectocarpus siliculosus]|uniref:Uncharacterized protein n=1 Tax=Ectocarpus siliculosus TaxID=2880 RepID=D8LJ90_ECTSI|nr:expressed unknown protein [Ectocarpus siliculosus]|eukprot:CBN76974.1 expressed unknown protein [Ectocarpus siliculosus]